MSKYAKLFMTVFCLLILVGSTYSQTEIRPTTDIGALRNAIIGANDGDIIILERGKVYYSQVTIDVNVNLTIKADEATTGRKPIISPLIKQDGSLDREMMFVRANLTCENIHFHAGISGRVGNDVLRGIVWVETENMRAVFDGCYFEDFDARTCQLEAPNMRFFATNCVWMDDHKYVGPSEGRSIDLRQFGPDTLSIQNCSFVNVGNRWIRHMPSGGRLDPIKFAHIEHCTFVNGLNYNPAFDLGHLNNLVFKNNIVYNPGILGTDYMVRPSNVNGALIIADPANYYSSDKTLRPNRLNEEFYDRTEGIVVFACHGIDSMNTQITMHHNNAYMDPAIAAEHAKNDTISSQAWMCSQFENSIQGNVADAFFEEELNFVEAPDLPLFMINNYIGVGEPGRWGQNPWTFMYFSAPDSIDLSYGTTTASYTAAEGGFPLGDLNWYPAKKTEWETYLTAVEAKPNALPAEFRLSQNYPNPFNPETAISYSTAKPTNVRLIVYNVLGKKVRTLVDGLKPAGSHNVIWNGLNDLNKNVPGGMYFYRLDVGSKTSIKKMILMK